MAFPLYLSEVHRSVTMVMRMLFVVWQLCTTGGCEASELAGGGNGLHTSGVTGSTGGMVSGLVGFTAGQMNLLFLVYLVPQLVWAS